MQRGWCGETALCRAMPRWRERRSRGRDGARAHARHMRRRTSGLCQLTLHPRPISRPSSAFLPSHAAQNNCLSLPFSAAAFSAAAFSAAAFSAAALELPEPICSLRWWRRELWRRERVGRVSLTRNRRKSQAPKAPKVRSMTSSTKGASRHRPGSRVGHKGQRARAGHEVTVSYLSGPTHCGLASPACPANRDAKGLHTEGCGQNVGVKTVNRRILAVLHARGDARETRSRR